MLTRWTLSVGGGYDLCLWLGPLTAPGLSGVLKQLGNHSTVDIQPTRRELPPSLRFLRRDWLYANHVLMFEADAAAGLVDSGHCSQSAATLDFVHAELSGQRLTRLLNSHCHSDHMGENHVLQQRHTCSVEIPLGEREALQVWRNQDAARLR